MEEQDRLTDKMALSVLNNSRYDERQRASAVPL
jgi:hypothetical protein